MSKEEPLFIESDTLETREAEAGAGDAGKRVDTFLAGCFTDVTRARLQRAISTGDVLMRRPAPAVIAPPEPQSPAVIAASEPQSPGTLSSASPGFAPVPNKSFIISEGDAFRVTLGVMLPFEAAAEDIPISVVYEDDDVIVIDKPRGMVVHPARGNMAGTLVNALLHHGALRGGNNAARPGVVHRIDKNTSGLLVFARNEAAHARLAEQFAAHTVTRRYSAVVRGAFNEDEGTVDAPVGKKPNSDKARMAVVPDGKPAITHWRVLERFGRPGQGGSAGAFTLLELRLETGRTHQIRVHMEYIGRPILGDDLYGTQFGDGQVLHAGKLGFDHPASGERMEFESPLPEYFAETLAKLRRP